LDLGDNQSISVPATANNTPADLSVPLPFTDEMSLSGILDSMSPVLGMDHQTAHLFTREAMDHSFHAFTNPSDFSAIQAPHRPHGTSSPSSAHLSDSHSPITRPSAVVGGTKRKQPSPSISVGGDRSPRDQHNISDGALDEDDAAVKRQRNTLAARRYRQKRLDRISDLESALSTVSGERDDLKLQLARREAEVAALREMLAAKK
jgi:hypothetical protein